MTRIAAVRVLPYALPLKRPWRMAGTEMSRRHGHLVVVETAGGGRGLGDHAILPLAAQAPGNDHGLGVLARTMVGLDLEEALRRLAPGAVESALECALLDALAQQRGLPLRRLFAAAAPSRVEVNAVAEAAGLAAAVAAGYRVVKMKVGRRPVADEVALLRRLAIPAGVRLRLDANRAWSWPEACRFVDGIAGLPVESLEEPLVLAEIGRLDELQQRTAVALALDESLPEVDLAALLARPPVRRLVLKPSTLGGWRAAHRLAMRARGAGLSCVVTTAVDSAVGVTAAAHLAAALAEDGLAHGLATAEWLAADVALPPPVRDGWMDLGEGAGLGLSIPTAGLSCHPDDRREEGSAGSAEIPRCARDDN